MVHIFSFFYCLYYLHKIIYSCFFRSIMLRALHKKNFWFITFLDLSHLDNFLTSESEDLVGSSTVLPALLYIVIKPFLINLFSSNIMPLNILFSGIQNTSVLCFALFYYFKNFFGVFNGLFVHLLVFHSYFFLNREPRI